MLLGCALSAWAVNAATTWCGKSYITVNGTWYTAGHEYLQPAGKFDGASLGTFEQDFTLGGELQAWEAIDAATMYYQVDDGEAQSVSLPRTGTEGNNSKHYGEGTVSIAGLDGGQHTLSVWFQAGDAYDSNNSQNYVATFTVAAMQFTLPAYVFLGEEITLNAQYEGVASPVYTYSVKAPEAADFTAIEGTTYTPTVAGEHTFRVTVTESTSPSDVVAEAEKTVMVRELPDPITIKVKVPAEWGTTISLWCWDDYNTGMWVSTTAEGEWYTATIERLYPLSFIVVNGTDWADGDNSQQTVNVAAITASGCYEVGAVSTDEANQGKREVTTVDCGDEPGSGTGMAAIESSVQAWANGQDIQAVFDGVQRIQVYTVSGQLLHEIQAEGTFSYPATRGLYLLRIGGDTHKVAVK